MSQPFRKYKANLVKECTGNGIVLDLGCGDAHYKGLCKGDYIGVDINLLAKMDIRVDVRFLPFREKTFDFILMFDLIEHINHLSTLLREVRRVLTDIGRILITTPNWWSWDNFFTRDHIRLFTKKKLKTMLELHGFKTEVYGLPLQLYRYLKFLNGIPLNIRIIINTVLVSKAGKI